jgi:hypothetical protein
MSKWIEEIIRLDENDDEWFQVLVKINNLLKRAMNDTDDEKLHDDIAEELNGTN